MFEKEGIKYAIEETVGTECLSMPIEDFHFIDLAESQQEKAQCFKDGAEFGYKLAHEEMDYLNKHWGNGKDNVNEWHYVKDGDLPKENKICLLYLGSSFNPITGWIKDGIWYFEDDRKNSVWQSNVIAWKEIVLPKEKENAQSDN